MLAVVAGGQHRSALVIVDCVGRGEGGVVVQRGLTADLLGQRLNITVLLHMMFRLGRFACKHVNKPWRRWLVTSRSAYSWETRGSAMWSADSSIAGQWWTGLLCCGVRPSTLTQPASWQSAPVFGQYRRGRTLHSSVMSTVQCPQEKLLHSQQLHYTPIHYI